MAGVTQLCRLTLRSDLEEFISLGPPFPELAVGASTRALYAPAAPANEPGCLPGHAARGPSTEKKATPFQNRSSRFARTWIHGLSDFRGIRFLMPVVIKVIVSSLAPWKRSSLRKNLCRTLPGEFISPHQFFIPGLWSVCTWPLGTLKTTTWQWLDR